MKQSHRKSAKDLKKNLFLLIFTKELIRHSSTGEVFELKRILEEEPKGFLPHSRIPEKSEDFKEPKNNELTKESFEEYIKSEKPGIEKINQKLDFKFRKPPIKSRARKILPVLKIPEPKLPERFQYLRPIPLKNEIEVDKIGSLIKDAQIRKIECNGPNKEIIVEGSMGRKKTNVSLTREEIERVINTFSEKTKIPVHEGIFRVVVGNLIFIALVSEIIGSKFVIRKMVNDIQRVF